MVNPSHFQDELGLLVQIGLIDTDTILSFIGDAAIAYLQRNVGQEFWPSGRYLDMADTRAMAQLL